MRIIGGFVVWGSGGFGGGGFRLKVGGWPFFDFFYEAVADEVVV